MSQFAYHFHVVGHALIKAFCFQWLPYFFEIFHLFGQIVFDLMDGAECTFLGGHEEVCRIDAEFVVVHQPVSADGVDFFDGVDFVIPEHDTQQVVTVGQEDVHRVTFHAEITTVQVDVVAYIKAVDQTAQEDVAVDFLSAPDIDHIFIKVSGISHAVDA